jgi:predicted transposase YbfD/YdcC
VVDRGQLAGVNFKVPIGAILCFKLGMQNHPKLSLIEHFKDLPDPRVNRTKDHDLIDILVIAVCTLLCAGESFNDMEDFGKAKQDWFKTFLPLRHGIPSHDTFNRLFAALAPQRFLDCFLRWTQSLRQVVAQEIVALDGKALRRALNADQSVKYIVSAWAESNGLVLGQLKVADKSNEITALPELLRVLELSGCIVTVDAMGCQKKIAQEIVEADADYVLALKGNHETVHEEVKTFLDDAVAQTAQPRPLDAKRPPAAATLAVLETVEKDHGRLETRRYYQSVELDWFADRSQWAGLRSVGMVEASREIGGQRTVERRYYLSSLPLGVEPFARAVRGHWGVENKLHWVLDVCFREDQSRARAGYAAENLATLRRLALNLLKREKTKKRGIKGKQLNASWDHAYLLRLLGAEL